MIRTLLYRKGSSQPATLSGTGLHRNRRGDAARHITLKLATAIAIPTSIINETTVADVASSWPVTRTASATNPA